MLSARKTYSTGSLGLQQHSHIQRSRRACCCIAHKRGSIHRSCSGTTPEAVKGASGEAWVLHINAGLSLLLASSIVVNTLATPLLAPPPADSSTGVPVELSTPVGHLSGGQQFDLAEARGVHAEAEVNEQQQWWQHDQQVWQEITSAAELNAYLTSNQPPPAWPALDSTSLSPRLRLVEFYAAWCPACKAAAPGMAEVAGDPDLRQHCSFARVNIDRVKPLVRQLGITKIPTVLLLAPNGTTLDSFRASGQVARDAITQQLAAMQQEQQQQRPSLPPLLPGGAEDGEPPSDVTEDNISSSNGAASTAAGSDATAGSGSNGAASNGSNSETSDMSSAACGVVPDPSSCGQLPPGIAMPSSTGQKPSAEGSVAAGGADGTVGTDQSPAAGTSSNASPSSSTSSSSSSQGSADVALQAAKQQFLQQYGSRYGYGGWLEQHYQQEIGYRLGPGKHYLDYTGAALYPASLLEAVYKDLLTQTYGNPHSAGAPPAAAVASAGSSGATITTSSSSSSNSSSASSGAGGAEAPGVVATPPAAASEAVMEAAAAAVLEHLHADPADYQVVFTRSATDALRMVGEMFPWTVSSSAAGSTASRVSSTAAPSELEMLGAAPSLQQQLSQQPSQQLADATGTQEPLETSNSSSGSTSSSSSSSSSSMPKSQFVYTRSNHNSVLGIGAYAAAAGAELVPVTDEGFALWLSQQQQQQQQEQQSGTTGPTYSLLAFPAEDNYAGVVYPLSWINRVNATSSPTQRTLVLLDAAAYLPTHNLDLSTHPADFVAASFYKMFGYPTGLGVLVLRTEHVPLLNKVYFGGGSVALATPEGCWHVSKCDPAAALSDGTPNYLGAAALKLAYDSWDSRGGMQAVQAHTDALSQWLYSQLSTLHHSNGAPLVQLYGRHGQQQQQQQQGQGPLTGGSPVDPGFSQGGVFNFQVLAADGQPVSFSRIDREATAAGLYLRSGCVCNPGACYDALGLQASEVQALAGLKEGCGDEMDFATVMRPPQNNMGSGTSSGLRTSWWPWQRGVGSKSEQQQQYVQQRQFVEQQQQQQQQQQQEGGQEGLVPMQVPLGSVRASLGWASTFEDVYALVDFLRGYLT